MATEARLEDDGGGKMEERNKLDRTIRECCRQIHPLKSCLQGFPQSMRKRAYRQNKRRGSANGNDEFKSGKDKRKSRGPLLARAGLSGFSC